MPQHKASSLNRTKKRSLFRAPTRLLHSRLAHALGILLLGGLVGFALWTFALTRNYFGFGVAIAVPLATLFLLLLRLNPRIIIHQWYRCVAILALAAAAWGTLEFFSAAGPLYSASPGGSVGSYIVGDTDALGIPRVVVLAFAGVVLLRPRLSLAAFRASFLGLFKALAYSVAAVARLLDKASRAAWAWLATTVPRIARGLWAFACRTGCAVRGPLTKRIPAPTLPAPARKLLRRKPQPAIAGSGAVSADVDSKTKSNDDDAFESSADERDKGRRRTYAGLAEADMPLTKMAEPGGWHLPSIDVLDREAPRTVDKIDNDGKALAIEKALASYGIDGVVVETNPGPSVTQFGVEPGWVRKFRDVRIRDEGGKFVLDETGNPLVKREEISRTRVKVDAIANLDKDLAMALAAPSIRIEAPVPGKSMVGIEVPNMHSETVSLRSGINSLPFQKLKDKSKLAIVLGKGSGGQSEVADLTKFPHLLVAGATGSGKSIGLRSILVCLLMQATPRDLRLLLIDPKRVELVAFNSAPHLIGPVILDVDKVVDALRWAIQEMEERYKRFSAAGARNIEAYNKGKGVTEPLPYLLIMIDELADLMMAAPFDVEHSIIRLAQLGRATGIHLVVATQRPSVDVITGLIKANFPTRLSFAVSSLVDSRTILDTQGAEKLLGKGDMLFLPQDASKPKRIQGVYVSDEEVERVVRAWSQQRKDLLPSPLVSPPEVKMAPPAPTASGSLLSTPGVGVAPPTPPAEVALNAQARGLGPPTPGLGPKSFYAIAAATSPMASPLPTATAPRVEKDPLMPQARAIAEQVSKVSPSLLQRRLKVGYNKAVHLVELLEEEGYGQEDDEDVF